MSWTKRAGLLCAVLGAAIWMPCAQADTAVLLEAGNGRLREDVQWLADRGVLQLSTSSWPLPLSALEGALAARRTDGLSAGDEHALASVQREVARQRQTVGLGARLQTRNTAVPVMGFDAPLRAEDEAGAWVQASGEAVAGRLQMQRLHRPLTPRQSETNLEGSYLAAQLEGQVLYAGQLAHAWGPGQDGSLVWSNAAMAIPGAGLRRGTETAFESPWLAWVGPWSYELFVGKLQHNLRVPGARAFAMRLQAAPLPGLELGASRMIHWGGAVGGNGGGALWDAFLGRSNTDATGGAVSNEIAGFDLRYTLPGQARPLTVYGQLVGEDESNLMPSKQIGLLGLQFKHVLGDTRWQWHVESADTMTRRVFGLRASGEPSVAYNHSYYRDGMYQEGLPIAHFLGGDGRVDAIGLTLIPVTSAHQLRYGVRVLKADVNASSRTINLAFPARDDVTVAEFAARWQAQLFAGQATNLRLGLTTVHSARYGDDASLLLGIELPLN